MVITWIFVSFFFCLSKNDRNSLDLNFENSGQLIGCVVVNYSPVLSSDLKRLSTVLLCFF